MNFEELHLSPESIEAVREMGFVEPTEIQQEAIPALLKNKEVIAKAPTGTGKTCAFGIPMLEQIDPSRKYPQALVLCPTRELCTQLRDDFCAMAKFRPEILVAALYGGQPIERQLHTLKLGAQVLIATPGRMIDHIKHHSVSLKKIAHTVLDEADEMLDMGFFRDVRWILDQLPKENKLSMFSATLSNQVLDIGWIYQRDPVEISVEPVEENKPKIEQYAIKSTGTKKIHQLAQLIQDKKYERSIVFCNTKYQTSSLCGLLKEQGLSAECIHGDLMQGQRNKIMADYKAGKIGVLVVTDVAARGIDVSGVDAVFNFDVPLENEYYLHRIGRTGRAKQSGVAYTFYSDMDEIHFRNIIRYTRSDVTFLKFDESGNLVLQRAQ